MIDYIREKINTFGDSYWLIALSIFWKNVEIWWTKIFKYYITYGFKRNIWTSVHGFINSLFICDTVVTKISIHPKIYSNNLNFLSIGSTKINYLFD